MLCTYTVKLEQEVYIYIYIYMGGRYHQKY